MNIHYVDTHAHIMGEQFQDDLEEIILKTENNHVDSIMIITLSNKETLKAIEFSKRNPNKYKVAAGIFPMEVYDVSDEYWSEFVELVNRDEVSCVGEIGLDYYWEKDEAKREKQREYFIKQIELAKQINKPFLVHSRDAMQDTYEIMKEHHHKGLLHCFPGSKEMAIEFTKLGYYIALGGAVTFKNARHSHEVIQSIDLKYLLSETDSPYMAPTPYRGKRNDPSYIPIIVDKMAEVRGIDKNEMANIIYDNWLTFLGEK